MMDNHTQMFHSHTSKTSTNQNVQSNSNNNCTQLSNQQVRRRDFVEPRPKSQMRTHNQVQVLDHSTSYLADNCKRNLFGTKQGANINTESLDKHSAQGIKVSGSLHSHNEKLLAAALDNNVLDYSPFNFLQGINPRRLLKGRSLLGRASLVDALKCTFCNCVIVQGQECDNCEGNFCSPCIKQWQASDSAKIYSTPCKCPDNSSLKQLNKLKQEYLNQIRFKCNNQKCLYQLTYDELLLGTHELDDCNFMNICCEGCGTRIFKQDQIRHESIECSNPIGKCNFCQRIFGISEMLTHRKECGHRSIVKVEYVNNNEIAMNTTFNQSKFALLEFDQRPDQEYRPSGHSSGSKTRQKSSNESKGVSSGKNIRQSNESPEKQQVQRKTAKSGGKRATRKNQQQPVEQPVAEKQVHYVAVGKSKDVQPEQPVKYLIPVNEKGKITGNAQPQRRGRGLGLISHQDNMSQVQGPQESLPAATQSTSRKENNTNTGIVYTQSSAHPIQSQNIDDSMVKAKSTKNCIIIDDESDSDPKEKFSSQPVGTQPFGNSQNIAQNKVQQQVDKKHNLKRRSRSRNALDQEELYREALAEKKNKELLKHQTSQQEHSSNIHLSELERSAIKPPVQPEQRLYVSEQKEPTNFSSNKKTPKTARSSSRFRQPGSHHRQSVNGMTHLNPRKISVQSKRLTRQQAKAKGSDDQVTQSNYNQQQQEVQEEASSCLEYDMESGEMTERKQAPRSRELEQIIAASSSSNVHHLYAQQDQEQTEQDEEVDQEEQQLVTETNSEVDMEDEEENDDEKESVVMDDQPEDISQTSESMLVQTCQNLQPQSTLISNGNFKNSHSALNGQGTVRQHFQQGITKVKKQQAQARQNTMIKPAQVKPSRIAQMSRGRQQSNAAQAASSIEARRSSRNTLTRY